MLPKLNSSIGDSVTTDDNTREADRTDLSEDTVFTLLSARRKREMLRILAQSDGEMTVADMTAEISHREHGGSSSAAKRKRIYVSLHQTHIPKLEEAGVVERNVSNRSIRLAGSWKQLYAYLEFDPLIKKRGIISRMFRPQPPGTN